MKADYKNLMVILLIQAFGASSLTPLAHASDGEDHETPKERIAALKAKKKEANERIRVLKEENADDRKGLAALKKDLAENPDASAGCDTCKTACPITQDIKDLNPKALCLRLDAWEEKKLLALIEADKKDKEACQAAISACGAVQKTRLISEIEARIRDRDQEIVDLSHTKYETKSNLSVARYEKSTGYCSDCSEGYYESRSSHYGGGYGFQGGSGVAQVISASAPIIGAGLGMWATGRGINAWENSMDNYYQVCAMQGIPCGPPQGVPGIGGMGGLGMLGMYGASLGGFGGGMGMPGMGLGAGIGLNLGMGMGSGFGNPAFGMNPLAYSPYGMGTGMGTGLGFGMSPFGMSPFGGGLNAGIGLHVGAGLNSPWGGSPWGGGMMSPWGGSPFGSPYGMNPFMGGMNGGLQGGLGLGLGLGMNSPWGGSPWGGSPWMTPGINPYAQMNPWGGGMMSPWGGGGGQGQYMMQMQMQQQYMMQMQQQMQQQRMYQAYAQQVQMQQYMHQVRTQQLAQSLMMSQQQVAQAYSRYQQIAQMYAANQYQAPMMGPGFGAGAGFGLNAGIGFNLSAGAGLGFGAGMPVYGSSFRGQDLGGSGLPTTLPSYSSSDDSSMSGLDFGSSYRNF